MAHAYTPGLKVSPSTHLRCKRLLPISGEVKVSVGDQVHANDIVAQTEIPGNVYPINLSNLLATAPAEIPSCMLKQEGDQVSPGDEIARSKGFFGFFQKTQKTHLEGTIESVSHVTGQVMLRGHPLPVQISAYVPGTIIEVIEGQGVVVESHVTFIQGIFGIGGERYGNVVMACERADQTLTPDLITEEMKDCIVIGGARMTDEAITRAIDIGASAVVSGGMDDQDLKDILGYDLGVAITGTETIGTTIIITEGFGDIAMAARTFELFSSREGSAASVNGATQIRAGVMRPEIVIPLQDATDSSVSQEGAFAGVLEIGSPVRMIRDPYFGQIGEVSELPPEPTVLESGSKARILKVRVGEEVLTVPRANVEMIAS